jgi:predicted nucleotidyltransferase
MPTAVETKEEIVERLRTQAEQIRSLGVRRLGVFGSFVKDAQRPESDVDVLVEFEPERKSFDGFMELAFLLEELLQRRVELVTPESLSPYLRPRILTEVQDVSLGP